ncbi:MAG: putative porin [Planctomycetota bacterium]|jgi:hypothetical protein
MVGTMNPSRSLWLGIVIVCCLPIPVFAQSTDEPGFDAPVYYGTPAYSVPSSSYAPTLDRLVEVWEKIDFFGDLRLRYEGDFNRNKVDVSDGNNIEPSDEDRHQGKFRFRIGAHYPFHEDLRFEIRMRTKMRDADEKWGEVDDDPRDDDVVFGDAWRVSDVGLDLLNLKYSMLGSDWMWVQAGKFEQIFLENPVMGGLIWDPDLNPEGAAVGVTFRSEDGVFEFFNVSVGEYIAVEQDRASDVYTFAAQASFRINLTDHMTATGGSGYLGVSNPTPDGNTELFDLNEDNYTVAGDFVSKFRIFDSFLALGFEIMEIPAVVSGEWIVNTGADINQDHGWTVGAALGQLKQAGDVRGYYQYQDIEQDALFSPFARYDFIKISNYFGSATGLAWRFTDNMELATSWSWVKTRKRSSGAYTKPRHETRIRLDLNIYF